MASAAANPDQEPPSASQDPAQQTLAISDLADAGYFRCRNANETIEAFYARTPGWFHDIQNRVPDKPMVYRLYEPIGMRVLIAEGEILAGESDRLTQALLQAGQVDEVWLSSPGGNSAEGLLMAEAIRARGIVTRVPRGYACISACSTAFLGGALRYVDSGALYGIHMFTNRSSYAEFLRQNGGAQSTTAEWLFGRVEQNAAQLASARSRFLLRMGVSLRWMDEAFRTSSDCVNYLPRQLLQSINVTNAR